MPHTDEINRYEEHLQRHPIAPDGQSEPRRMLAYVLIVVFVGGLCFVLVVLPFVRLGGIR